MAARAHGRIVALEGPTGVGKSTLGRRLAAELGAVFLEEAYDRLGRRVDLSVPTRAALLRVERTLLREEALRFREARRLRGKGRTVVADTGFLGPLTYAAGIAHLTPRLDVRPELFAAASRLVAADRLGWADLHLVLHAPARELAGRVHRDGRTRDPTVEARHRAVGAVERRIWAALCEGPLAGRAVGVSAGGTRAQGLARLERAARRRPPPGEPPGLVGLDLAAGVSATLKRRPRSRGAPR